MSRSERITRHSGVWWHVTLLPIDVQVSWSASLYQLAGMAKQWPYILFCIRSFKYISFSQVHCNC